MSLIGMEVAFYLNIVSPHQLPLARAVAGMVGVANFTYIHVEDFHAERARMGWNNRVGDLRVEKMSGKNVECRENADKIYTGIRCIDLIGRRLLRGRATVYYSERWFKPPLGILRLLSPSYFKMARRFSALLRNGESLTYCPVGIHAARDMARLCGLMHGDLRCLLRSPRLGFERKPGGRVFLTQRHRGTEIDAAEAKKYCLDKMRMWGYFVERGDGVRSDGVTDMNGCHSPTHPPTHSRTLRVLWVGRLLKLKRVDTIIRAVGELSKRVNSNSSCSLSRGEKFHSPTPTSNSNSSKISLDIYGTGPEEKNLKKMAAKYGDTIKFHPSVPIGEVRKLMREHDVYVFGSNGYEGWGAVVSEALEEGMRVLGTYEAGASVTILPKERLFHSGDWRALLRLLEKERDGLLPPCSIGEWTAEVAASRLLEFA